MSIISHNIASLAESQSLAMAQRVAQLRLQGIDIINMSLGEPDFNTPQHIKDAAIHAVADNYSHYGPVKGLLSLREAICRKLLKENNLRYTPDEIIVSVGAKQSICNTILTLINPGDEVIIPTPCWVSYGEMVKISGGKNVFIQTSKETNYKLTAEQLKTAINDKTKLLILCSPNNPTGSIYTYNELKSLAEVLKPHQNIFVISDEVYERLNYTNHNDSLASFSELLDRVIVVNGVSKAYAMTGYRIGWIACHNKDIVAASTTLQGQYLTCACMVAQKAAQAAYEGPQSSVETMRYIYQQRLEVVLRMLNEIPGITCVKPQGAFYVFPDVSHYFGYTHKGKTISNSTDLADYLLNEAHVACVDGAAFGENHCLRFSFATSESAITQAFQQIKVALQKLRK